MKTVISIAFFLVWGFSSRALGDVPVVHTIDRKLQEGIKFLNPEYLVLSPNDNSGAKLPMLIYLHGSGGRGDDIAKVNSQVMGVWRGIRKFGKGPCIVVAPQCLNIAKGEQHSTWIPEDLNIFLQHLKASLPIDHKRIYLTGNSMGGYGTWVWGAHNPEHFAAIAPVSGGTGRGGPKDVTADIGKWAENLAKVPVYAFAGAKDKVVPPDRSESLIAAIQEAGGKQARLKIYPDEGHGARRLVFSTAEIYDWMFLKTRE